MEATSEAEKIADSEAPPSMLEVHAPHETIHSWKDFFIHIATITIGLLIAISLEQAVEYVHHRRQATRWRKNCAPSRGQIAT